MDSNNVFSETKLIWSNNLSIGSNPSPPKKTVIKHLIRRKHCWLRRAKEQGRPKIFFPVFLLVQDLPQCKGCAKDVQDPVKSLCKGSTSMYKNKYVQGYARSLPSTAVVQNLYETCTRIAIFSLSERGSINQEWISKNSLQCRPEVCNACILVEVDQTR